MGGLLSRGPLGAFPFSHTSVSLFDLAARFFVPTRTNDTPARAGAVKDGALAPPQGSPSLTAPSTTAHLVWSGRRHRGEPACGARRIVPHPCIRRGQRPEP